MSDNKKFTFKRHGIHFKSQLIAACDAAGISLEDFDRQHTAVLQAEFGRLGISGMKAGFVTLGKGCETAREGIANSYKPGGKSAHASIRFYREGLAVDAYVEEFPSAKVGMTDEAAKYVIATCERAAEIEAARKAGKKSTSEPVGA